MAAPIQSTTAIPWHAPDARGDVPAPALAGCGLGGIQTRNLASSLVSWRHVLPREQASAAHGPRGSGKDRARAPTLRWIRVSSCSLWPRRVALASPRAFISVRAVLSAPAFAAQLAHTLAFRRLKRSIASLAEGGPGGSTPNRWRFRDEGRIHQKWLVLGPGLWAPEPRSASSTRVALNPVRTYSTRREWRRRRPVDARVGR